MSALSTKRTPWQGLDAAGGRSRHFSAAQALGSLVFLLQWGPEGTTACIELILGYEDFYTLEEPTTKRHAPSPPPKAPSSLPAAWCLFAAVSPEGLIRVLVVPLPR